MKCIICHGGQGPFVSLPIGWGSAPAHQSCLEVHQDRFDKFWRLNESGPNIIDGQISVADSLETVVRMRRSQIQRPDSASS